MAKNHRVIELDEVVVTALGVSREKKSLGYAVQEVGGEDVSATSSENLVNALSGKVAGVQVKVANNIGGSSNIQCNNIAKRLNL